MRKRFSVSLTKIPTSFSRQTHQQQKQMQSALDEEECLHQCKVQIIAGRDHEPKSMVAKRGHEILCRRRLDKISEPASAKEHAAFTEN